MERDSLKGEFFVVFAWHLLSLHPSDSFRGEGGAASQSQTAAANLSALLINRYITRVVSIGISRTKWMLPKALQGA
jgi:hypothetical protein